MLKNIIGKFWSTIDCVFDLSLSIHSSAKLHNAHLASQNFLITVLFLHNYEGNGSGKLADHQGNVSNNK